MGLNSHVDEQHVSNDPEATWVALVAAIRRHRSVKLRSADDRLRRAEFSAGASAFTWGQKMSASVAPSPTGSVVTISGVGNVSANAGNQGRMKTLTTDLFSLLSQALPDVEPEVAAGTGPVSVADELAKLAALRDSGVLSTAEFEQQKAKLLA